MELGAHYYFEVETICSALELVEDFMIEREPGNLVLNEPEILGDAAHRSKFLEKCRMKFAARSRLMGI